MTDGATNDKQDPKNQPQKTQEQVSKVQKDVKEEVKRFEGYLAEVVEVNPNRTGIYGEIKQAMCRVLEGRDTGRVIRRNVSGRIKVGDKIRLPDTTREDKPIRAR